MKTLPKKEILNITFTSASEGEVLEYISESISSMREKVFIVTPNPEVVVIAHADSRYKDILNSAQISLPDGIGIVLAGKLLGKGLEHRITGVDFMKKLCRHVSKQAVNTGYFGAKPGVAEKAADCLRRENPELSVTYVSHEWNEVKAKDARLDILFVALGSPKQEQWIYDNLDTIPAKVVMGVGGSFDMIAGNVKRAPLIVQRIGLEWLWRLILQPWRIKRQLRLLTFIRLVFLEKITR